ncbi:MAG: response regulator [Terriglobales bacterium]
MKKILICDDSLAEMKLMQSLLQSAGYWPVAVSDSRQIEQTITAERPQLILLDVVMPDRNGYQVCRDLKGNAEFNRIPVIIVSSKDQESDKFWAQQQGADGYVIKPFTAVQLLDAVRKFV